jgi:hypothetical protein
MLASQIPTKFPIPFGDSAAAGTIRPVPIADQTATSPGAASLTTGFPPATGQPLASGGIPPSMQDFNGILNQITAWCRWQGAGGLPQFDATFAAKIGGYPAGAVLSSATLGHVWLSVADNNATDPEGGASQSWIGLSPSAAKTIFNVQRLSTTTRTVMSGSGAGILVNGITGLSYTKQSATSLVLVWAAYTTYQGFDLGTANGATTARLNVGSFYDEVQTTSGFQISGTPFQLGSAPIFFLDGVPAGVQAVSLQFKRADNLAWSTIVAPTGADVSGLPTPNVSKFIFAEVEP